MGLKLSGNTKMQDEINKKLGELVCLLEAMELLDTDGSTYTACSKHILTNELLYIDISVLTHKKYCAIEKVNEAFGEGNFEKARDVIADCRKCGLNPLEFSTIEARMSRMEILEEEEELEHVEPN